MKGLRCSILKSGNYGDCSINGVSARFNQVTLIGEGVEGPFEPSDDAPAVYLKSRRVTESRVHVFAKPAEIPDGVHSMMGGCFIWTSDSRFPSWQPIALHDRVENGRGYAD